MCNIYKFLLKNNIIILLFTNNIILTLIQGFVKLNNKYVVKHSYY